MSPSDPLSERRPESSQFPYILFSCDSLISFSNLLSKSGVPFLRWTLSMRILRYGSGNEEKFSHAILSDFSADRISSSTTNGSLGMTDLPASVIRPSLSNLWQRSMLSWVQDEPLLRGLNLWTVRPSSSFFTVLSIHPKQRASSTASRYARFTSSGVPRLTTTQHSDADSWLDTNHSWRPLRSGNSRGIIGPIGG